MTARHGIAKRKTTFLQTFTALDELTTLELPTASELTIKDSIYWIQEQAECIKKSKQGGKKVDKNVLERYRFF